MFNVKLHNYFRYVWTLTRFEIFWGIPYFQKFVKNPPFSLLSEKSGCLRCHLSKTSSSNLDSTTVHSPASWIFRHQRYPHQTTLVHRYFDRSLLSFKDIASAAVAAASKFFSLKNSLPVLAHHLHWQFMCRVELERSSTMLLSSSHFFLPAL